GEARGAEHLEEVPPGDVVHHVSPFYRWDDVRRMGSNSFAFQLARHPEGLNRNTNETNRNESNAG
ncbi:MAG: hypothetical protein IJI88_07685, partial [Atopobiaceae bacterium]|nr:hypothetical protein [Atopobiaceae bacterium]